MARNRPLPDDATVDCMGREIRPGHRVVYPVREGTEQYLVVAKVVEANGDSIYVKRLYVNGEFFKGRRKHSQIKRLDRVVRVDRS